MRLKHIEVFNAVMLAGTVGAAARLLNVTQPAVTQALRRFRRIYPGMNVSVRVQHSREIAQAVALQEGDISIVYGSKAHPAVDEAPVATGRLVCVSCSDPAAPDPRGTVTLEALMRTPCIRIDDRDPIGTMLAEQWSRLGGTPQGGITVQTHHLAMVLAEEGFGPAIVDSFTATALRNDRLHVRTVLPEVAVEIRALLPQGVRSPQPVEVFIEAFRQVTGGEAPGG